MRLAFVVGSPYEKNGQLPALTSAEIDSQYLARRLALDDIGATVVELPAERGVAERMEQALSDQAAPIESVLVAFVGYGVFSKERGPAMLLDGERLGTFSFFRLRTLLERYSAASCVMAEVLLVGDGAEDLPGVGKAIAQTLTEKHARGTSGLLAIRASHASDPAEPVLASVVTTALDWLSASGGSDQEISLSALFATLQTDERFKSLPATRLVGAEPPFLLIRSSSSAAPVKAAAPVIPVPAPVIAAEAPLTETPSTPEAGVMDASSGPPPVTATSNTLPAPAIETAAVNVAVGDFAPVPALVTTVGAGDARVQ